MHPPITTIMSCPPSATQAVDLNVSLQQLGTSLAGAANTLTDVQVRLEARTAQALVECVHVQSLRVGGVPTPGLDL